MQFKPRTFLQFHFPPFWISQSTLIQSAKIPNSLRYGLSWRVKSSDLLRSFHESLDAVSATTLRVKFTVPSRSPHPNVVPTVSMCKLQESEILCKLRLEATSTSRGNRFEIVEDRSCAELNPLWRWLTRIKAHTEDHEPYRFAVQVSRPNGEQDMQMWRILRCKKNRKNYIIKDVLRPIRSLNDKLLSSQLTSTVQAA